MRRLRKRRLPRGYETRYGALVALWTAHVNAMTDAGLTPNVVSHPSRQSGIRRNEERFG